MRSAPAVLAPVAAGALAPREFQYSMIKSFQGETLFGFSNFGHWKLLGQVFYSLSSLPTRDRVNEAPMYLKWGRIFNDTLYHPGSPSTSETVI